MATLIKEVRLIKVEQTDETNSYKYWNGQLFDDGNVHAEWGRVGCANPASGDWSGGETYLDKKKREKEKKGYVEQKTVGVANTGSMSSVKVDSNLREIAKKELLKDASNTVLAGLVDRLVKSNIHKITATTNITFNNTTGLFQTPLGIVTPSGISEARDILAQIHPLVKASRFTPTLNDYVNKYVLIVPQNLGMKRFNAETVFPDETAVQKQSDILDSLEASYQAMTTSTPKEVGTPTESGVFKVDLDTFNDSKETDRITRWFNSSNHSTHGYRNVKIRNFFKVKIHDNWNNFNEKLGNVKEIWHGSGEGNLLSILKVGLKSAPPSTVHITGKMFGAGHYGALDSSKSMQYTFGRFGGNSGDTGWLIVADFALGNTYYIKSYGGNKPSGYDSIWAKKEHTGLRFDELIVPKDNQVRIKYLLEVK